VRAKGFASLVTVHPLEGLGGGETPALEPAELIAEARGA
jgi:hypothetical protein